jgi:hypothetical protein
VPLLLNGLEIGFVSQHSAGGGAFHHLLLLHLGLLLASRLLFWLSCL